MDSLILAFKLNFNYFMKKAILSVLLLVFVHTVFGQKKITVDDIYRRGVFYQASVYGINWMNDGQYYSAQSGNDIVKYDVTTGSIVETIVKGSDLGSTFEFSSYSFSADEKKILFLTDKEGIYRRSYTAKFYVYDLSDKKLVELSKNGRQAYATFSPDGSKVAFTRDNNLFYVDLSDMSEKQITTNGKFNKIINGSTDWVTEEELTMTKAFEWSGDSQSLLYLTFDESEVPEYNMQVWNGGQLYPNDYRFKYPKAGETNAVVSATIYQINSGKKTDVKFDGQKEFYVARIRQTKAPSEFSLIRLNRLQNKLDVVHVNAKTGSTKVVLTESHKTYVDLDFVDDLTYLNNGKQFVMSSEKSGYKHLYLYDMSGKQVRALTSGDYEITSLVGINDKSKKATLYYISTEGSPLERYFYAMDITGKKKVKLTAEKGVHRVNMSEDFKYYIDYHSSGSQPLKVNLKKTSGNKLVKVLEDNQRLQKTAKQYNLQAKEFFTFPTVDGTQLNGLMIKPNDFNPNKKYPVLIYQYSGPGSQSVMNNWGGGHFYWHQMLAQNGYIVAVIDTRGTGGRGAKFKKMTYEQLGKYESEDHLEGAKYLGKLSYIDKTRIGIWGWSYGGYMSSLAMFKGEGLFKAAIAVAPVTNWRFYDTIYTERYMGLPQDNGSGYDDNSPTSHVQKLRGNYLLIHGTGDDNVHFQNAVTLQNALIAANKQFDSFYYPDRSHGIYESGARPHLFGMMTNWVLENL